MYKLQNYINLLEVNRIVSGIAGKSGMPKDHVQAVWDSVDKEVIKKHERGVTDNYKEIGSIVKAKLGVAEDPDDEEK
jgi:hypothetical protein